MGAMLRQHQQAIPAPVFVSNGKCFMLFKMQNNLLLKHRYTAGEDIITILEQRQGSLMYKSSTNKVMLNPSSSFYCKHNTIKAEMCNWCDPYIGSLGEEMLVLTGSWKRRHFMAEQLLLQFICLPLFIILCIAK
jgi:hypothetical protein